MRLAPDLNALSPAQRAAVTHPARPILLACGPGSGKTRILTHRIHWLIHQGLRPGEILALTFLARRGYGADQPCPDRCSAARRATSGRGRSMASARGCSGARRAPSPARQRSPSSTAPIPAAWSSSSAGISPSPAIPRASPKPSSTPSTARRTQEPRADLCRLLPAYRARCREANALDFADLLAEPVALLDRNPGLRHRLRARFRAVLIDEAQDLCPLQHTLIEQLTGPDGAVTFGSDDDQAIYGWRGADVGRLHAFERIYRGGRVRTLGENSRSTPEIVAAAARLIAHNRTRRVKPLRAVAAPGPAPVVRVWPDDRAEAEGLAAEISRCVAETARPVAVLARITACLRPVARACQSQGLTVQVFSDRPLGERAAVRDVLAVCRVLVNPADWLAWERLMHLRPCGMGAKALAALRARIDAVGVVTAIREAARSRPRLGAILHQLDAWRAADAPIHERVLAIVAGWTRPGPFARRPMRRRPSGVPQTARRSRPSPPSGTARAVATCARSSTP